MAKSEFRQDIGRRLRAERQRLGFSQRGLADLIGCTRLSVLKYENGQCSPCAESLVAMEAGGIDIRFILTGLRVAPSGVDRERFKIALTEVLRQASARNEALSTSESLDLAWRFYDAVNALHRARPVAA